MRFALVALAVSVAPCGAELPKSESGPESPPQLQGTWEVNSVERDGKTLPPGDLAGRTMSLTVKGSTMTLSVSGRSRTYLVEVVAGKTPSAIDFYSTSCVSIGKEQGREVRCELAGKFLERGGIYALDGDTLRICVAGCGTGEERPTAFATAGKPGYELYVLTRRE
jgi:uncharacterized protein (TIGR03067 family)